MSAINKALSEISEKTSPSELIRAEVPKVSSNKPWLWLVAGFSLSLAMGGWAISSRAPVPVDDMAQDQLKAIPQVKAPVIESVAYSPTSKITPEINHPIYTKPETREQVDETAMSTSPATKVESSTPRHPTLRQEKHVVAEEPLLIAQVTNVPDSNPEPVADSSMSIEQVELTHRQLAVKARGRAEKAMDANDMHTALTAYREALRYEPTNTDSRQKLAALYFGKGDTRRAYEIIQEGIHLDTNSQVLRLALAKLLVKANQPEAALSPLVYLPPAPTKEYLAMRAALAQKQKQNAVALESYQLLVQRDAENARWWLGLAIQQERAQQWSAAIRSYNNALGKVGISNQSQNFIRERLTILKQLENAQ